MSVAATVLLGIVGTLSLWGCYRSMEMHWPYYYVSLQDTFALRISQTWWRLVGFRGVPVFVIAVGAGATSYRLNGAAAVSIATMVFLHIAHTNALAFVEAVRGRQKKDGVVINYGGYHALAAVIAAGAGVVAGFCYRPLAFLVPMPEVLLQGLWIAFFVGIVGGVVFGVFRIAPAERQEDGISYLTWRAARDIGVELLDFSFTVAVDDGSDPVLLQAVMHVESLQRPRWVRNLEQLKGKFIPRGSYGITQESAPHPLSDMESIRMTSTALLHWGLNSVEGEIVPDDSAIWTAAANHNPDTTFIRAVQEIYRRLLDAPLKNAQMDPLKHVNIVSIRRYPDRVGVRLVSDADEVSIRQDEVVLGGATKPDGSSIYWAAEVDISFTEDALQVTEVYSGVEATATLVLAHGPDAA